MQFNNVKAFNTHYKKLAKDRMLTQLELDCIVNYDYYHDDLEALFAQYPLDEQPVEPGWVVGDIIDLIVDKLIPLDSAIVGSDEKHSDFLADLVKELQLWEKLQSIALVGAVTGTVALKSVRPDQTWSLDILPADTLSMENGELIVITREFKDDGEYISKEGWTDTTYREWQPVRIDPGRAIKWGEPVEMENTYGMIPITIIQHNSVLNKLHGASEITKKLKKASRQLAILNSKCDVASQFIAVTDLVRKNDADKTPIRRAPGTVHDITSNGNNEVSLEALDAGKLPTEVLENIKRIERKAYNAARVTNPDAEKEMKAGGTVSRIAWEAFNQKFIDKIEGLRLRYGSNGIEAHLQKIIQMGKNLNIKAYRAIQDDYEVELQYPPYFEPSVEEKQSEVYLMESCNLPVDEEARRKAAIMGISKEETIALIAQEIQAKREAEKPQPLNRF